MASNKPTSFRFDTLPPEMAEMILDLLEDSTDILNVFKVFPGLDGQVMWKRQEWLIDQVAPLLFPWLDREAVLSCRVVSRRWLRGFDQFLETSQPNGLHNGTPHTSPHLHLSREASRAQSEIRQQLATFSFQHSYKNLGKLTRLLGEMGEQPPARNPFIGRKLFLCNEEFGENNRFWTEARIFLEKFGAHVWYLEMEFDPNIGYSGACQVVIRSLPLLPNLRGLTLSMPIRRKAFDGAAVEFPTRIFQLPHLETLNFANHQGHPPSRLYPFLLKRYASQIRKLKISSSNWRANYSQILVELTEFTLVQENGRLEDVVNVLASLRAPELRRLELHMTLDEENVEDFHNGFVVWLRPFRKIVSVKVVVDLRFPIAFWGPAKMANLFYGWSKRALGWTAKKSVAPFPVKIPSLKSLSIELCQKELCELVNSDFLGYFPELEYLDINCFNFGWIFYFRNVDVCNPRIWAGMLPKLKELNLGYAGRYKCFSKGRYEWIEKRRLHNRQVVAHACIIILFLVIPILLEGLGISMSF